MKWFFENPDSVAKLQAEAIRWLGTPFRKFSRVEGTRGGVDCIGLCEALMIASGVVRDGEYLFPRMDADYSSAAIAPRVLRYLRGQHSDPQSARLAEVFAEIPLPKEKVNIPSDYFLSGDLLVLRSGGQFHVPVILEGRKFINAVPHFGVREGNIHDPTFSEHLIALFRARAPMKVSARDRLKSAADWARAAGKPEVERVGRELAAKV